MTCGIYVITNQVTNNRYVGQSNDCERRFYDHLYELDSGDHWNRHLQNSYNKYGRNAFIFSILEECSIDQLTGREQFWADHFRSQGIELYNTGQFLDAPNRGKTFSDDHRESLSRSHLGKSRSPEFIAKVTGRKRSPESIAKQRETLLKKGHRPPSKLGTKQSPETIAKRVESRRRNQENKDNNLSFIGQ